jgi:hypothetical protein
LSADSGSWPSASTRPVAADSGALVDSGSERRDGRRWAALLDAGGLALIAGIALAIGIAYAVANIIPVDTDMYWRAGQSLHYYGTVWAADANSLYVYPPPLAQAIGLLTPIGWPAFVVGWTVFVFAGFWASTRRWSLLVLALTAGAAILWGIDSAFAKPLLLAMIGNVQPLLAAAVVIGFRWPAAWAFIILTKIAPGIGLLWFVFRREWRQLGIALGATAAIVAVSFVFAPAQWADFVRFIVANVNAPSPNILVPVPLPVRIAMSVALIWWGAATNRRWVLPFAAGWASFALYEWTWLTMALAGLALIDRPTFRWPAWRPRMTRAA